MLVRFESNVAGEMLMFAEVARRLLRAAGKECSARGVILAEQVPEIVARLRAAVEAAREREANPDAEDEDEDEDAAANPVVTLGQRAQPFIELLELTAREPKGFVIWEAARDFGE